MHRLGVLGWPVAHSRSPAIHNAALAALGMGDWHYQLLPVPPELFARDDARARRLGLRRRERDDPAQAGGAGAGGLGERGGEGDRRGEHAHVRHGWGDRGGEHRRAGTDRGDRRAARRQARARAGGGGQRTRGGVGAARGGRGRGAGLEPHARARGGARARAGRERGERAAAGGAAGQLHGRRARAGAGEELGRLGLTQSLIGEFETVVDLVYREGATELLATARAQGARTLDGLEILVAQGALSFELWTGREAPLQVMGEAARASDNAGEKTPDARAIAALGRSLKRAQTFVQWGTLHAILSASRSMGGPMDIDFADLLMEVVSRRASDLHLTAGAHADAPGPRRLTPLEEYPKLSPTDTREIVYSILSSSQRQRLETDWQLDFAYSIPGPPAFV